MKSFKMLKNGCLCPKAELESQSKNIFIRNKWERKSNFNIVTSITNTGVTN